MRSLPLLTLVSVRVACGGIVVYSVRFYVIMGCMYISSCRGGIPRVLLN